MGYLFLYHVFSMIYHLIKFSASIITITTIILYDLRNGLPKYIFCIIKLLLAMSSSSYSLSSYRLFHHYLSTVNREDLVIYNHNHSSTYNNNDSHHELLIIGEEYGIDFLHYKVFTGNVIVIILVIIISSVSP